MRTGCPVPTPRSGLLAAGLTALALGAGCASARTGVVVVVDTDLAVPGEIASVRARAGAGACTDGSCTHDFVTAEPAAFPFSFALEPRGDGTRAPFTLEVTGRDGSGATVVARHVESSFVAGRTLLIRVPLERACRGVSCLAGETCALGACVSRAVDPRTLSDVVPGHELDGLGDAGERLDGPAPEDSPGPADALVPDDVLMRDDVPTPEDALDARAPGDAAADAPSRDAGGALPASCADLPTSASTGVTSIDPDGPGGAAPFDAWCENEADGRGWTLLLKVDPASSALAYDEARWTSAAPMPFGVADVSVGDALLLPYWTVPIAELRIESASGSFVTVGVPRTRAVLSAQMSAGAAFDSTLADWLIVVPGVMAGTVGCSRAGLSVALPSAAPELRVRIGLVGGLSADCSDPAFWFGVGAHVATSRALCEATTNTAGGGRVCGPPIMRGGAGAFLLVYGR